ncbi:MAG: NAD(P)H-dependent oxidoreductase [Desulfuromonadaceae bacterium]
MKRIEAALILCGSPKRERSASRELGAYLARRLEAAGVKTVVRSCVPRDTLLADVGAADLLVLSLPLYADGIPARMKEALMLIAATESGPKYCAALVQCGFLESAQNDAAIEMCRLFTRDAGFIWLGGLGRGAGGMLAGKPLEQSPPPLRTTREALDRAAELLSHGEPFSPEVKQAFRVQPLPRWLYAGAADLGFLLQLIRNGRFLSMFRKPYRKTG